MKRKTENLDADKYATIVDDGEKIIVNINDLHEIIQNLRIDYMEKYHREPKVLVVPEYVDYIFKRYLATTYAYDKYNLESIDMYMGMQVIPTPAIKYYEYMKVY